MVVNWLLMCIIGNIGFTLKTISIATSKKIPLKQILSKIPSKKTPKKIQSTQCTCS